jgi:predicted ATPase
MRIGFSGASGQGKTSVAKELLKQPEFMHYSLVGSTARSLSQYGLNKQMTVEGQLKIVASRVEKELATKGCYVSDRTPMDSWGYTMYMREKHHWPAHDLINHWKIIEGHMPRYDFVFFYPRIYKVRKSKYRVSDMAYHDAVSNYIEIGLEFSGTEYCAMPEGTVQERAEFIKYKLYSKKYT